MKSNVDGEKIFRWIFFESSHESSNPAATHEVCWNKFFNKSFKFPFKHFSLKGKKWKVKIICIAAM